MPISREQWALYPADWRQRRTRILERAGYCCEQCGVRHGAVGVRGPDGEFVEVKTGDAEHLAVVVGARMAGARLKVFRIVLTIAHLDRTGPPGENDGPLDCSDDRLAALCQRCHLRLDAKRHAAKAAATLARRKYQGQASLELETI